MNVKIEHPVLWIEETEYNGNKYYESDLRKMKAEHAVELMLIYDEPLSGVSKKFTDNKGNPLGWTNVAFQLPNSEMVIKCFMWNTMQGKMKEATTTQSLAEILSRFGRGDVIRLTRTSEFYKTRKGEKEKRVFVVEHVRKESLPPLDEQTNTPPENNETTTSSETPKIEVVKPNTAPSESPATELEKTVAMQLTEAGLPADENMIVPTCESEQVKNMNNGKPLDAKRIVKIMKGELQ